MESVENPRTVSHSSHRPWKSRHSGGIPTFPQLRRRSLFLREGKAKALPKRQRPKVGQIKPPKWAKRSCQTHSSDAPPLTPPLFLFPPCGEQSRDHTLPRDPPTPMTSATKPKSAFWSTPPFCPFFSRARLGVILCARRTHALRGFCFPGKGLPGLRFLRAPAPP